MIKKTKIEIDEELAYFAISAIRKIGKFFMHLSLRMAESWKLMDRLIEEETGMPADKYWRNIREAHKHDK